MSCNLTSGRLRACDAKAGVETVYLGKWTKDIDYSYTGNTLIGLNADYYEYQTTNAKYNTTLGHSDEGEAYDINISFDLPKVNKQDSATLNTLSDLNVFSGIVTHLGGRGALNLAWGYLRAFYVLGHEHCVWGPKAFGL